MIMSRYLSVFHNRVIYIPDDQILNGLTPLPSQMAIGATWDTNLAEETGVLLGREIAGLGFNLILNPSLDVLENPNGEGKGDLGVRTFGGDPFWVGEMGKAYIKGLHLGSNRKTGCHCQKLSRTRRV